MVEHQLDGPVILIQPPVGLGDAVLPSGGGRGTNGTRSRIHEEGPFHLPLHNGVLPVGHAEVGIGVGDGAIARPGVHLMPRMHIR